MSEYPVDLLFACLEMIYSENEKECNWNAATITLLRWPLRIKQVHIL